ncbi:MAG: hypothetical protein JWN70_1606 [Planctomycetaceae bacterium]|nr:hypothetical protein [Planctomycetaceae bacterium]
MKKFTRVDILESQLESLVQQHPELVEAGLKYVDHQKVTAGGRLDVLLVDSGKAFVIAELKIVQDDGMLLQGIDYYDYVSTHIEAYARLYKDHGVDPTKPVRLLLIAPSFSQSLVNRCKWIDAPISLFTYQCLKFDDDDDLFPIFTDQPLPTLPPILTIPKLEDNLAYITDSSVRTEAQTLLDEMKAWKPGNVTLDAIRGAISLKINNRVFAYFHPRRKHYVISTYNADETWTDYPVKSADDLAMVKPLVRASMETN